MYRDLVGPPPEPVWRPAYSHFVPGGHLDHVYCSSLRAGKSLKSAFEMAPFTREARRKIVTTYLPTAREDEDGGRASLYVMRIERLAGEYAGATERAEIAVEDLPSMPEPNRRAPSEYNCPR